jgi:hypothetical protein
MGIWILLICLLPSRNSEMSTDVFAVNFLNLALTTFWGRGGKLKYKIKSEISVRSAMQNPFMFQCLVWNWKVCIKIDSEIISSLHLI